MNLEVNMEKLKSLSKEASLLSFYKKVASTTLV